MKGSKTLRIWFDHGLGDCAHFAQLLQLYKRRGWNVAVHYEANKADLWRAAGIDYVPIDGAAYHRWIYVSDFNRPVTGHDGTGNKIYGNLNVDPLPPLGPPDDVWNELCAIRVDGSELITPKLLAEVDRFLDNLPRPIVLLHTHGTNSPDRKSLADNTVYDLYHRLLDQTDGSLVLLDWDSRVPMLPHGRVRHLKQDWGHISVEQLYNLYHRADVLLGVDSGPYHFAAFARLPVVGVFTHHYPASVTLPNPMAFNLTGADPSRRAVNIAHRRRWNIGEYAGAAPTADELARHLIRATQGPRYLNRKDRIGRDLQLQQWVRDWCCGATGLSPRADRSKTFDLLLRETTRRFASPQIVETGCTRSPEDWGGAGNSTYLLSAYLDGLEAGHLISVDNDPGHCDFARADTAAWSDRVEVVVADSVAWLRQDGHPIDVLYLDSVDTDIPGSTEHALAEIRAAEPRLRADSLVVFDDTIWNDGWLGKGTLAIPYMLARGWRITGLGYQVVLERNGCAST